MGAGRPKKMKLISIDKALEVIKNHYLSRGVGEDDIPKVIPAKGTIYNKICSEVLKNHGSKRLVLLDENEVIKKLCS